MISHISDVFETNFLELNQVRLFFAIRKLKTSCKSADVPIQFFLKTHMHLFLLFQITFIHNIPVNKRPERKPSSRCLLPHAMNEVQKKGLTFIVKVTCIRCQTLESPRFPYEKVTKLKALQGRQLPAISFDKQPKNLGEKRPRIFTKKKGFISSATTTPPTHLFVFCRHFAAPSSTERRAVRTE